MPVDHPLQFSDLTKLMSSHPTNDHSDPQIAERPAPTETVADEDELATRAADTDSEPLEPVVEATAELVQSFVESYSQRGSDETTAKWLVNEFRKHPDVWQSDAEIEATAQEVAEVIEDAYARKSDLHDAMAAGKTRTNWLARQIETIAASKGVNDVGGYASSIETALEEATANSLSVLQRRDGAISGCLNLDGFIAEQHHVDTFNIDAVAKGSPYRAKVLSPEPGQPYGKNSVDIGIYDGDGKLARRYQAKYGADAEATGKLFDKGKYPGQRKLVPEGHSDAVDRSVETIEIDGVSSKPLSKEQAKQRQNDGQQKGESKRYEWDEVGRGALVKKIAKDALIAATIAVGFQAARIAGRRAWNALRGRRNPPVSQDLAEFLSSSLSSAGHAGIQTAVAGGLIVAVKRGLLGSWLKETPPGRIAAASFVALENVKTLWKLGKGEITRDEALDAIGETTTVAVASLAAAAEGAALGATLGSVFGPVGTAIGGFTGGLVAGMAGSVAAKAIYEGGKAVVSKVADMASSGVRALGNGVRNLASSVWSIFA